MQHSAALFLPFFQAQGKESKRAAAYLRGEALSEELFEPEKSEEKGEKKPAKGWTLMTVDGYSIGWAKLVGGVLKNHYPKGLRR